MNYYRTKLFVAGCTVVLGALLSAVSVHAQEVSPPVALRNDISVRFLMNTEKSAHLLARNPHTGELYYLNSEGNVYRILVGTDGDFFSKEVYTAADHGVSGTAGFTFANDGTMFLLGNSTQDKYTVLRIRKGVAKGDGTDERVWTTVAESEPYPRAGIFDHLFNAIVLSPDQKYLFVQGGARGDHGEVHDNGGAFPGLRELPLTSVVLRLPADGENIQLLNDEATLRAAGYFYADGFRNTYSMAFAPDGELFGVENSGDRDDSEEMNWIREGHHYGFPWRMGLNDNPQQFPGYDPEKDLLVNKKFLAYREGFFHNDPTFPPPPTGVVFTDPLANIGPDADKFRDPNDGVVKDASDTHTAMGTFTAHRSPLGLVFDTEKALSSEFRGDGFCLSWTQGDATSDTIAGPFMDASEDLLHLKLIKTADSYNVQVTKLVEGFHNPVAAVLVKNTLYVLETGGDHALWEIVLPTTTSVGEQREHPVQLRHAPNPVVATGSISFALSAPASVSLVLHDARGNCNEILLSTYYGAGEHRIPVDAASFASGVYFYTLTVGQHSYTQSMLIVR